MFSYPVDGWEVRVSDKMGKNSEKLEEEDVFKKEIEIDASDLEPGSKYFV